MTETAETAKLEFSDEVPAGDRSTIARLLALCDLDDSGNTQIAPLVGGANNRNYTAEVGRSRVVVRVANTMPDRFAVDLSSAAQAQRHAAAVGIAPELLAVELPEGNSASRFVPGETLRESAFADAGTVKAVGETLRRLHEAPSGDTREFSPFEDVRKWAALARSDGTELPDDLDELHSACDRIERCLLAADLRRVLCHNDTVPQNFLDDEGTITLVDWDYAGSGWACFEVASFAATARMSPEMLEVLLEAYAGEVTPPQRASIELLGVVAAMREVTWALMATPLLKGTTTLLDGWSYESHLADNLAHARRLLASLQFDDLLACAASDPGRSW